MPRDSNVVPVVEVTATIEAFCENLHGTHSQALHCPRAALSAEVVSCLYRQWV